MASRKRTIIISLFVTATAAVVLALLLQHGRAPKSLPEGLIQANGRIEGDPIIVASEHPGRIVDIAVREGDGVEAGDLLVRLDDRVIRARLRQAEAAADAAKASTGQCQADLALLGKEVPLRIDSAAAGVGAADAVLLQAQADEEQAGREDRRYLALAGNGYASEENAERASTRWQQAKDEVVIARAALDAARNDRSIAELGPDRLDSKRAQVLVYRAAAEEALARVEEIRAIFDELTISSPSSGIVTERFAERGEVVGVATPLFELVNLDDLHLKVFIPESAIGKVRRGLPARIHTDAFPDEPFDATVRYIASRAQFTPKEIQTPDERVKLVYAVELAVEDNSDHRLTPGLPADAVIRWLPEAAWTAPQW